MTTTPEIAARTLRASGFSFLMLRIDGTKKPIGEWAEFQTRQPSQDEINDWFGGGKTRGVGAIMGRVSGNAETLDFDDLELFAPFCERVESTAPGLIARLVRVDTPRPGRQLVYRCAVIGRNQQLAAKEIPATPEQIEEKKAYQNAAGEWMHAKTLIETRGEGGYIVAVGSPARVHPTKRPYTFGNLDYSKTPTITPEEREILLDAARGFDEVGTPDEVEAEDRPRQKRERKDGELLPGHDFNERGDVAALLAAHGWQYSHEGKHGQAWTRPGKDLKEGSSATLFPNGNFYVFSSNAAPLNACNGHSYSPFALKAILDHAGDFKAAAKALAAQGFGKSAAPNETKPKAAEEIEWLAPIPFNEYSLPAFPVDAFPAWLGDYIKALATATQVPVDAPASLAISVVSAAASRRYRIVVRGRWSEPLNTYVVVVQPPANRKSAVHDEVTKPLAESEQDLIELERDWIAKVRTEYKILEAKLERLRKDCAKADEKSYPKLKAQAEDVAAELASKEYPVDPQMICDDVTPETLATLLAEQGGRMALFSAEGGIFEIMAGRYSKGSNLEVFLKGHAGDTLRVNRRGRAEHINKPALTIGLTVQPEVIRGLANKPEFRGRGLLGRFFYSMPVSLIGRRDVAPEDIPQGIEAEYSRKVKALAELQPKSKDEPREIVLAPSALAILTEYARGVEIAMREGGGLAEFTDWAGKLVGGIARIAGLLHLAEHIGETIPNQVSAQTVHAACRIGDYFTAHARAAFAELGASQAIEDAKYVLRWIKRELPHRKPNEKLIYTKREIHRGCQTRFKTVDEIDPAINLLLAQDYLRELDTSAAYTGRNKAGRRPSAKFALNPFTDFLCTIDTIDRTPAREGDLSIVSIMQGGKKSDFSGLVNGDFDQIAALTVDCDEVSERAAVYEFDAGLSRSDAEARAEAEWGEASAWTN